MANLSCGCSVTNLIPRIRLADGSFIYPEVSDEGIYTIDVSTLVQAAESPLSLVAGGGIVITENPDDDHNPTIGLCLDPDSPIPLEFVTINGNLCLRALDPDVDPPQEETPNTSAQNGLASQGVLLQLSGTADRNIQLQLALAPGVPFSINSQGQLAFDENALAGFTCDDLATCSINDLPDVALNGAQSDLHFLYWDPTSGVLRNIYFPEFLALSLGVPGQFVPGAPTAGPPVELRYDPSTGTFGWQPV